MTQSFAVREMVLGIGGLVAELLALRASARTRGSAGN
jgi:hypothetical protein